MRRYALTRPVLVDLTADDTAEVLEQALTHGMDLVLANKRPLADRQEISNALWQTAQARGRRILHEATVGAGLPIIDTYHKLVESGDRVHRIEGLLSGTLGYVLSQVSDGVPFSKAVRTAMTKGYTEPDPRDDLSGMDVARKALILGSAARLPGRAEPERSGVARTRLGTDAESGKFSGPPAGAGLLLEESGGRSRGRELGIALRRLGYRATKLLLGCRPYLRRARWRASRARTISSSLLTERYNTNPLVITGPGAGAEVTAAGVLNDILRLAGG